MSDFSLSEKGVLEKSFASVEIDTSFASADTDASLASVDTDTSFSSTVIDMSLSLAVEASTARERHKIGPRGILLEPDRGKFLLSFFEVEVGGGSTVDLSLAKSP
jgi:hypothetical protein